MPARLSELIQIDPAIRGESDPDRRIALLAQAQHRSVARRQLLRLAITKTAIDHRVETGRLHPRYRCVYVPGAPGLSVLGEWMAAVLAGGPGAVLGCRSGAELRGFLAPRPQIHVIAGAARVPQPGLCFHRIRLAPDEVGARAGIPTTTVARLF